MEIVKLTHQWSRRVAKSDLFNNIKNYDDFENRIRQFGAVSRKDEKNNDNIDIEERNRAVGAAYEVFTEYFLRRFGQDTILDIHNLQDTSLNEYEKAYDFFATDSLSFKLGIQVKFRSHHQLFRKDLNTFFNEDADDEIKRILVTNHFFKSAFHFSFPEKWFKRMRVIDRVAQEAFIDRSQSFWAGFSLALQCSAKSSERKPLEPLWEHQQTIINAALPIIVDGGRGKVICATGGGKTRVQFELVQRAFENGAKLQIVVAPTIALLLQHHESFARFGMFGGDNKPSVIHFRTGTDPVDTDEIDYSKTTNDKQFAKDFSADKPTLIFTTFASERNLFDILRATNLVADVAFFDEFHNLVQQDNEHIEHVKSLPSRSVLFFSASEKRGKLMNSFDKTIFGERLANITYKQLRDKGILVPRINVRFVRLDKSKLSALENDLKKSAERNEYDLHAACTEGAAAYVARHHMREHYQKWSNVIVFSKRVAMCNDLVASPMMNELIMKDDDDGIFLLKAVSAQTPAHERNKILAEMRVSDDYIIFQHSVFKEGIDAPSINGVVLSRDMSVISTQQAIGRAVRVNDADRKALSEGRITLDNPDGWQKYSITVFVIIHDGDDYGNRVREFVEKVQESGIFSEDDWDFADLAEERHGVDRDEFAWAKDPNDVLGDKFEAVKEYVQHMTVEQEKQWKKEELDLELRAMSKKELMKIIRFETDEEKASRAMVILHEKVAISS